jgi:hypothetical protein
MKQIWDLPQAAEHISLTALPSPILRARKKSSCQEDSS